MCVDYVQMLPPFHLTRHNALIAKYIIINNSTSALVTYLGPGTVVNNVTLAFNIGVHMCTVPMN